jgi:predicted nucleic acid-binding protein
MLVCDASLVVDLFFDGSERGVWAAEQVAQAKHLHAPHLLDLEVVAAARKHERTGLVSAERVLVAIDDLEALPITRYRSTKLLGRIWELRHTLTAYDAAYVSLAEALALPLATTDGRLARAGGHHARILSP